MRTIEKKKMGRPTNDPKSNRVSFRLSEEDIEKINFCTEKTGKSKTDIIRNGINEIYEKIKEQESGGLMKIEKKKMGRPTNNPKTKPRQVRLDEECNLILEQYCKKKDVSKAEAIRRGIKKLKEEM